MSKHYEIMNPSKSSDGEYVKFTLIFDAKQRPVRISRDALEFLDSSKEIELMKIFKTYEDKIGRRAYEHAFTNRLLDIIFLGKNDFS